MSMILAIGDINSIIMAADTKASSSSGLFVYPDIHKLKRINNNCGIAITGQFKYGEILLSRSFVSFSPNNYPQHMTNIINSNIKNTTDIWYKEMGSLPDCTFIIAGASENKSKYFCIVTVNGYDVQVFETSFTVGEYNFLFANPKDIAFDECKQICEASILTGKHSSLNKIATTIIRRVSSKSSFVNDKIDILSFQLLSV